jgi:hypothetical protein
VTAGPGPSSRAGRRPRQPHEVRVTKAHLVGFFEINESAHYFVQASEFKFTKSERLPIDLIILAGQIKTLAGRKSIFRVRRPTDSDVI